MERKVLLDGVWDLYILKHERAEGKEFTTCSALENSGIQKICGKVPGNFELDMQAAGFISEPFFANNILNLQEFENRHLWYSRRFNFEGDITKNFALRFEGIDTFGIVYLNGNEIGKTDNMMIPFEFDAKSLKKGENQIVVHILPDFIEARSHSNEFCRPQAYKEESMYVRKPPHCYGWDIMPRALSGGIWRSAELIEKPNDRIDDFYCITTSLGENSAKMRYYYNSTLSDSLAKNYKIRVSGKCDGSEFTVENQLWHNSGNFIFEIQNPKLWWVRTMGRPNLYDLKVELIHCDCVVDTYQTKLGIRTVKLERTSTVDSDGNGKFSFYINGKELFVHGTNWVPLDAYHSRDKSRVNKALELAKDIGCNMIRCWGGNVYECDDFFDYCDSEGIAIWQDFAMACAAYPQDEFFCNVIRREAECVVRRLRGHASIVLWAGDNECDESISNQPIRRDPNRNKLTREVIPDVLYMMDPIRPYIPSSPYMDEYAFSTNQLLNTSERHLWGPRDYFKSDFYTKNKACFASETGYHGCTSPLSIEKYISKDALWRWQDNIEWIVHGTSTIPNYTDPYSYRINLMASQIKTLFGFIPENLEDFALLSQISQAEAVKFFIERFRINRPHCTGILWWNIIDGWPQFSDAIVDYYYVKKISYNYIKNSQQSICVMMNEPNDGNSEIVATNDGLTDVKIKLSVIALSCDKQIYESEAIIKENSSCILGKVPACSYKKEIYFLKWETEAGIKGNNHYCCANLPYDYKWYLKLMNNTGILKPEGFTKY